MIRLIAFTALLSASAVAHAGFVTGAIVGYVAGSSTKSTAQGQIIMSDQHSVIACQTTDGIKCSRFPSPDISANQFAGSAGYKVIYKKGISFNSDQQYIIMEVGR